MGLAANVTRRGGVYWWRGRIGSGRQLSRVIAKSLRTRDPGTARMIGTQVTGIAAVLRRGVMSGTMTFEQAETEIEAFLSKFPFSVDPDVIESLDGLPRPLRKTAERRVGTRVAGLACAVERLSLLASCGQSRIEDASP